jgi:hypothetical protein
MKLPVHQHAHFVATGEVRDVKVGEVVYFLCNGRNRGGHHSVTARITKVNRITVEAIETVRSYSPGTKWKIHANTEWLRIIEDFAITPDELAGVGVYRKGWSQKPKTKDMEAFKASVTPEAYEKILEEAMSLVTAWPSEYKSCLVSAE